MLECLLLPPLLLAFRLSAAAARHPSLSTLFNAGLSWSSTISGGASKQSISRAKLLACCLAFLKLLLPVLLL
jgi:hypothetical protein